MPAIHRVLIRTHHMTSRKKIQTISKAAKQLDCSVILKTGRPPGIMLAESDGTGALEWLEIVKGLRYKDFSLQRKEVVERKGLQVDAGTVREFENLKDFGAFVGKDKDLETWWKLGMGYVKDDKDP